MFTDVTSYTFIIPKHASKATYVSEMDSLSMDIYSLKLGIKLDCVIHL